MQEDTLKGQTTPVGRREFMQTSLLAGASLALASCQSEKPVVQKAAPTGDELRIAVIGVGGRGKDNIEAVEKAGGCRIVALCDVDDDRASETYALYPDPPKYRDFRVMLEKEKDFDAVIISTPDHTHAPAAMAAMQLGKHVYCEKPLTHTVYEARRLAEMAKQTGSITQMGNQGMAFEGNRQTAEWIASGAIGTVREVHAWSDRPTHHGKIMWPQGIERPTDTPTVPDTLDWDLWLGPAPHRPYHPAYVPFAWRGWWDFGSGGLGDMGIHNLAPVFLALNLGAPESVNASSTLFTADSLPLASCVHFKFSARGDQPPVDLHWYDGGLLPERPEELEPGELLDPEDGALYIGDKGKLLVEGWGGERPRLLPKSRMESFQPPPPTLPRSIGHHEEWIEACKTGGTEPRSNFAFAGPLTEAVLLGVVAIRTRQHLVWDSANLQVINFPDANQYISPEASKGWEI